MTRPRSAPPPGTDYLERRKLVAYVFQEFMDPTPRCLPVESFAVFTERPEGQFTIRTVAFHGFENYATRVGHELPCTCQDISIDVVSHCC